MLGGNNVNGLEALELVKQGKVIKLKDEAIYYRMSKDVIEICNAASKWRRSFAFNLNAEYEEYQPKVTGWKRNEKIDEEYYFIDSGSDTIVSNEWFDDTDIKRYEVANYFSTREKVEEVGFKQTLFRRLQRFADENNDKLNWADSSSDNYYIFYDYKKHTVRVRKISMCRDFGQVYFSSQEIAEKAMELFKDDLIKYFTQYK